MTLILPPDMEAFLCTYLRDHIADVDGLQVGSKKPPDYQGAYPPSETMAATLTGSAISTEASA